MISLDDLFEKKQTREKIVMLTAYDYPMAKLVAASGVDMILVGDSGGMVKLGYSSTLPVTMDEMISMAKAVRRGAPDTFVVADLPFLSYQASVDEAIRNAGRFVKECGADAVKLEGGRRMAHVVRAISDAGIVVQGHVGLTPQNATQLGGHRVQGKTVDSAKALIHDAVALEAAGVFSIILETVPVRLANFVTANVGVPTIGTGSGSGCDGQNLITPDVLNLYDPDFAPRYVKRYADVSAVILQALREYRDDVLTGQFPVEEHTYPLKDESFLDRAFKEATSELGSRNEVAADERDALKPPERLSTS